MPLGGGVTVGTIALISSIVGAGAATGGAIAGTKNAKLKREYESNLAALDQQQKNALEKKMQEAKTIEDRRKILQDTLSNAAAERIKAIEAQKAESQKTFNKIMIIGAISVGLIIVGLVIVKAKKGK